MVVSSAKYADGERTVMISPLYVSELSRVVLFDLHMKVPDQRSKRKPSFKIYRQTWKGINDEVMHELHGHQGNGWVETRVCLPPGAYYLSFEVTLGSMFHSDIAVDSIRMTNESCSASSAGWFTNNFSIFGRCLLF